MRREGAGRFDSPFRASLVISTVRLCSFVASIFHATLFINVSHLVTSSVIQMVRRLIDICFMTSMNPRLQLQRLCSGSRHVLFAHVLPTFGGLDASDDS
eukprot:scaffold181220_cov22-Prasinocladus_malaysianus.AAC.1